MTTGNLENNVAGGAAHVWKQAGTGLESIFIISAAAAAWLGDLKGGLSRVVTEAGMSYVQLWRKGSSVCVIGKLFPAQELTPADGAIAHVAWLAGTQVSSDGVGADGVLIAHILATCTLVVLCGMERITVNMCAFDV